MVAAYTVQSIHARIKYLAVVDMSPRATHSYSKMMCVQAAATI